MVRAEVRGIVREYEEGTTYEVIAKDFQKDYDSTIALVLVNGKLTELMKKMYKDAKLEFVTYGNSRQPGNVPGCKPHSEGNSGRAAGSCPGYVS